jgi:sugar phosphate permease
MALPEATMQAEAAPQAKMTSYRWVIASLIFVIYTIANADRVNLGIALPFIKEEFGLNNTEAGGIVSLLFMAYAVAQIPGGYIYTKFGVRKTFPLFMILTSLMTWLQGMTSSVFTLKAARVGLGLCEGPLPTGCLTTINYWFPPKEKGTATGIYLAASKCGPVIAPIIGVAILEYFTWRQMFMCFAVPGLILSAVWFFMVSNRPSESRFVSKAELDYINTETSTKTAAKKSGPRRDFGWLDKLIRMKKVAPVDSNAKVFTSWNIMGNTIGYGLMNGIIYTIMTWIPTYLMKEKGFMSFKVGFLASAPFVGAVIGNIVGGWISDRLLGKRRKPLMMCSGVFTTIMMYSLINAPNQTALLGFLLFMCGFLFSLGFSAFSAYPMGVTTKQMFPLAYGITNTGGQIGSASAPFVVGMLLDAFNWDAVFLFLAACSVVSVLVILTVDEPDNQLTN